MIDLGKGVLCWILSTSLTAMLYSCSMVLTSKGKGSFTGLQAMEGYQTTFLEVPQRKGGEKYR